MSILRKLVELKDLTNNEKVLVDFILEDPSKIVSLRPKEIAEASYVSVSTIYRLVDKLGLSGISDLKGEIAKSLIGSRHETSIEDYNFPILETDTNYQIMKNMHQIYLKTIDESDGLMDLDVLGEVVNQMRKSKRISLYASSANLYFAENFKFQMQEIGIDVLAPVEEYVQRLTAANSTEDDFAIIISYGGRGPTVQLIYNILKINKTKILLLTSTQGNPHVDASDYVLYLASFEDHYDKISSFATRLTIMYVLDIIFAAFFSLDYKAHLDHKRTSFFKLFEGIGPKENTKNHE
ncbi:hypothetical protein AOC36_01595 [Erysipelothrix larvae]|uniref:RpiR family transcriptional regulator n=1 Tax=Erysipelothrix larvae TaxID=1514105 RepID=A0A0X8GYG1_9FIRM|nr:MurR/RpiR family transcriptional regulator [Erysipelothrix larvae]AMC92725.1 hypothetical protein AOC36_01595 [Erysipelothrix larvae]